MAQATSEDTSGEAAGLYPIRTVSSLTGVNAVTLRAWERRYGLIQPQRTPKGHRLYTREDIARIGRVLDLLNQGISISQVKPLVDDNLAAPSATAPATGHADEWQRYRERLLQAISRFDEAALDAAYNDALSLYPVELVIRNLATPLLQQLGEQWQDRPAGVAEEHFFSVYLRNKLGARIHHINARGTGPRLLIACLPGEYHEIGMLFFALTAASHGYRVLLLGANLPLDQIPPVLDLQRCDAVVLSGSSRPARGLFDEQLPALVQACAVPVFVGGGITLRHGQDIEKAGATPGGEDFQGALRQIAARIRKP
jgi:DNA-binding transcriptional MerR regulator/methylmalonyl-CoA mutase cobalamin-binding subunit